LSRGWKLRNAYSEFRLLNGLGRMSLFEKRRRAVRAAQKAFLLLLSRESGARGVDSQKSFWFLFFRKRTAFF
jgi:hypothetical protein